jgi:6-phospho-3-hexuloisomerase
MMLTESVKRGWIKMEFKKIKKDVCEELTCALDKVDEREVEVFIDSLLRANKLFVMGVGRVMLMMRAFAQRLKHLGLDSYVVGETTIPAIGEGDLLVAASGSGETLTTVTIMGLAKKHQAKVALITASPQSAAKEISDVSVRIPCSTKLHLPGEIPSKQPMTSLFEQCLLIFCDSLAMMLQGKLNISEEKLWEVHANLE